MAIMKLPRKCQNCEELCANHIDFLQGLSDEKLTKVMQHAVRKTYAKDSSLFLEDEPVEAVYVIHHGKVKLSSWDSEGREQIVGLFSDYETIWEGIFIEESRYPYSGVCLTDVDCCKILRRDLEKAMEDPVIALRVIGLLSRKLSQANERVMLLASASPKSRVAGFLLQQSRRHNSSTVVHQLDEIAASIHLRPETVSRKIRELEREGIIRKTGQSSIHILDLEALERILKE